MTVKAGEAVRSAGQRQGGQALRPWSPWRPSPRSGHPASALWAFPPMAAPSLLWNATCKADLTYKSARKPRGRGLATWTQLALAGQVPSWTRPACPGSQPGA